MHGKNILVIEDDAKIRRLLKLYLEKEGYDVIEAQNGEEGMAAFQKHDPCFVITDLMMPKLSGEEFCKWIRSEQKSDIPLIMLTAKVAETERIEGLQMGADDYITKPFDYEIAMAKIKSQLRRAYGTYAGSNNERTLTVAGMALDVERLVLTRGEAKVDLSHTEAKILDELMQKSGTIVTRDRLLEKIWDDQAFVDENTLNVYVTRVRKKLAALEITDGLQTVRGQGYRLIPNWGDED